MIIYLIGVLIIVLSFLPVIYVSYPVKENDRIDHISRLSAAFVLGVAWPLWAVMILLFGLAMIGGTIYIICLYLYNLKWEKKTYMHPRIQLN